MLKILAVTRIFYHGAVNNESNMRGIPPSRQNHTSDPPVPREEWSDLFHHAIIAKENVDIENHLIRLKYITHNPQYLRIRQKMNRKTTRIARLEKNIREKMRYEDEKLPSSKSETKRFNGMRIDKTDKKLRSILYLALGKKGKTIIGQKKSQK